MRCLSASGISLFLAVAVLVIMQGCSGNASDSPMYVEPVIGQAQSSNRYLTGWWHCIIGPDGAIEAIPARETSAHYNVTPMLLPPQCNDCILFKVLEFKPSLRMLIAAVTLRNPTTIPVYDVRGILISDHIPPHDIMNRDGYTTQWDNGGPVERNPYILFSEEEAFAGTVTRIFYLVMPKPASFDFTYAVDVSWPKHAKEPCDITGYISGGLTPSGGAGDIVAFVKDWQDDVSSVTADTTELTGSSTALNYDAASKTWRGVVSNSQGQTAGRHSLWVWAESIDSGNVRTYQRINYWVGPAPALGSGWPAERCGIGGTGRSASGVGPSDGELKWAHPFSGVIWDESYNSSVIADGTGNVYVPLANVFVAVDINGKEIWTFPVDYATRTFTPFLRNDNVIVWPVNRELSGYNLPFLYFIGGDGKHASMPALLPETITAPAVPDDDGRIIIPSGNGIYTCDFEGYRIWKYIPGNGQYTVPRPPAFDANMNIYGVTDYIGADTIIFSTDKYGIERWTSPLNGAPLAQAVVSDGGGVFAASTAKDFSQLDKFGIQGRYYLDGSGIWPSTYSNYKGFTQFALAEGFNGYIYASGNGTDICYSVDGSNGKYLNGFSDIFGQWGKPSSAPAIDADNRVYVGCRVTIAGNDNSAFFGLDTEPALLWQYQGAGKGFTGSPVIGPGGYVFCLGVGSDNVMRLYCFGEK